MEINFLIFAWLREKGFNWDKFACAEVFIKEHFEAPGKNKNISTFVDKQTTEATRCIQERDGRRFSLIIRLDRAESKNNKYFCGQTV